MKIKNFLKDIRYCGVLYAVLWLFGVPERFENSGCAVLRKISEKTYDYCLGRFYDGYITEDDDPVNPDYEAYASLAEDWKTEQYSFFDEYCSEEVFA